jgi:predicted phage tail component-like protein
MNYCILNGKKSTLIKGLLIQSLPPISKPLVRTSIEEIDGRDGDVVTRLGYSAYDKQMSIGLFGDFDINEVIQFFNSEGTVIFSNEQDKFYYYKILEQIDFERLLRFRTATVTFHVQPFKYSAVDDVLSFSSNRFGQRVYTASKNGVLCVSQNGAFTLTGTASSQTDMYIPIRPMTLDGNYTLKVKTDGTGASSCSIRIIGNAPSDADSFGGTSLQLGDSVSLTADVEDKTFNYLWISVNGTVDFIMNIQMIDNSMDQITVINRGNMESRPTLNIYGSGTINLSINGFELFVINLGSAEFITLDGTEMNAYQGEILMNRYVTGNLDNLVLNVGANTISWTGNITKIEVVDASRWI